MLKQNKQKSTAHKSQPRILKGVALNHAQDQTIRVLVNRYKTHSKYRKRYKISKKYLAHDPENQTQAGDKVLIKESRPISKKKRWKLIEKD